MKLLLVWVRSKNETFFCFIESLYIVIGRGRSKAPTMAEPIATTVQGAVPVSL